jgi:Protein of unknown function (DUF2975)
VNASATSLSREDEVQSEIRKVRAFGRNARVVCAAIFGFGLVGVIVMLFFVVLGPIPGSKSHIDIVGLDGVTTAQLTTPALKMWAFAVMGAQTGVFLASVYQLYRLFGSLAAGAIYTSENVRRLRHVGLLWLLCAALGILIPFASAALVTFGFFDAPAPINHDLAFSSQSLGPIISAVLILLASWIMDVGLYEKDHADALRRDADLVI